MVTYEGSLRWCHGGDLSPHLFFLNVQDSSEELALTAKNLTLGAEPIGTKNNRSGRVSFMCYARNGATPTEKLFDYFSDISKSPLTIKLPKLGSWYFYIVPIISHGISGESGMHSVLRPCHSLQWEVHGCPPGKAGRDCSWERYTTKVWSLNPNHFFLCLLNMSFVADGAIWVGLSQLNSSMVTKGLYYVWIEFG